MIVIAELVLDLPENVPSAPQFVATLPPIWIPMTAPWGSIIIMILIGNDSVDVARQVMPKVGSLIWNPPPTTFAVTLVIAGSVPVKDSYLILQGSVSLRMVALPVGHEPTVPAEMEPISAPRTLLIVADLSEPSSVRLHLEVPNPPANSNDVHVALNVVDDILR